jgi:hypothetical protein
MVSMVNRPKNTYKRQRQPKADAGGKEATVLKVKLLLQYFHISPPVHKCG